MTGVELQEVGWPSRWHLLCSAAVGGFDVLVDMSVSSEQCCLYRRLRYKRRLQFKFTSTCETYVAGI